MPACTSRGQQRLCCSAAPRSCRRMAAWLSSPSSRSTTCWRPLARTATGLFSKLVWLHMSQWVACGAGIGKERLAAAQHTGGAGRGRQQLASVGNAVLLVWCWGRLCNAVRGALMAAHTGGALSLPGSPKLLVCCNQELFRLCMTWNGESGALSPCVCAGQIQPQSACLLGRDVVLTSAMAWPLCRGAVSPRTAVLRCRPLCPYHNENSR